MDRAQPDNYWSDSLKAATREAIKNLDVLATPDGSLPLKHVDGAFGTISLDDLVSDRLRVVDRQTGAESMFESADALIAAGWAID
ncbi:hypothetical protein [Microvirga arabica]|uniref:hypothetical protein n=1 Tax=Microvirga arabica TaxID=1128671 RepID=UPI00193A6A19|nr:hypothetical protein [Microvirga arabica]MBM1172845.1 hypothetical protein [Microvirga arabica]